MKGSTKKALAIMLASAMAVSVSACGSSSKDSKKEVFQQGVKKEELIDGRYYVAHKDGTYDQVYFGTGSFSAKDDDSDDSDDTSAKEPSRDENQSIVKKRYTRVLWYKDDFNKIPTLITGKGDKLIYYSKANFSGQFEFERFMDLGYSIGINGLTPNVTGRYYIETGKKTTTTYPGGDTDKIINDSENDSVIVEMVGNKRLYKKTSDTSEKVSVSSDDVSDGTTETGTDTGNVPSRTDYVAAPSDDGDTEYYNDGQTYDNNSGDAGSSYTVDSSGTNSEEESDNENTESQSAQQSTDKDDVSSEMVTRYGTIKGLRYGQKYQTVVYGGTKRKEYSFKCDTRILGSMDDYISTDYAYEEGSNGTVVDVNIPSWFNSGYYMINGKGVFRYINGNAYNKNTVLNNPNKKTDQNNTDKKQTQSIDTGQYGDSVTIQFDGSGMATVTFTIEGIDQNNEEEIKDFSAIFYTVPSEDGGPDSSAVRFERTDYGVYQAQCNIEGGKTYTIGYTGLPDKYVSSSSVDYIVKKG